MEKQRGFLLARVISALCQPVVYILIGISILTFIYLDNQLNDSPFQHAYSDAWEHTAALSELIESPLYPRNPHLSTSAPSPRFMPLYVAAGWLGHILHMDVFTLYHGLSLFNIVLLLVGVYLFASVYFRHRAAPVVLLLSLLFAWGTGIIWSNSTSFRALPSVAAYPSMAAFGLTLILWYLAIRFLEARRGRQIIGWFFLAWGVCSLTLLIHVLTGAVALGGMLLLALTRRDAGWRNRILLVMVIPCALLAVESWPYYSTFEVLAHGSGQGSAMGEGFARFQRLVHANAFYRPWSILSSLGVALLAYPLALKYLRERRYLFAVGGLLGLSAIYFLNLFVSIPLGHRALLFAVSFGQILIAAWLIEVLFFGRSCEAFSTAEFSSLVNETSVRRRRLALILAGACLLAGFAFAARQEWVSAREGRQLVDTYRHLTRKMREGAIVLTPPETGWPLPTFGGKVTALYHPNPLVESEKKRLQDTRRFFSPDSTVREREQIIMRYSPKYLLLNLSRYKMAKIYENAYCGKSMVFGNYLFCEIAK